MAQPDPSRLGLLLEGEKKGVLRPEHAAELEGYRARGLLKGEGQAGKVDRSLATERQDAERLKADITNARTLMGKTFGQVGRTLGTNLPLTRASDFDKALEPIRSNVALTKLMNMKANSPTGGGMGGATSDRDIALLQSAMGNLDPKQTDEQLERSLSQIEAFADGLLGQSAPTAPTVTTEAAPAGAAAGAPQPATPAATPPGAPQPTMGLAEGAIELAAGQRQIKVQGDPRLQDPKFRDGLEKLLNSDASRDEIAAYWQANGGPPRSTAPDGAPTSVDRRGSGIVETVDAGMRGAADVVTLGLSDEIAAIGNTILDPNTTLRDNLDRERATDRYDEEFNLGARLTGQIAGGLALPVGAARTPAALGRVGAAYGGAYGFGSAEGNPIERLPNAALGAAGGGALAAGLGAGAQALGRRIPRGGTSNTGATPAVALMAAADRQGVQPMPADVGGAMTRRLTSAAAQAPISAIPITRAGERVTEQALGARDRIAAGVGQVVEPELAGETARAGARSFITRTSSRGGNLYRTAERMAGNDRVTPTNALAALDRNIAELSEAPGGAAGLDALRTLRTDIAERGTVSVAGVRAMRTTLRDGFIKDGLRGSDLERRVNQVIDAASQDLVDSLTQGGKPEAARAFAVADRYWRNRLRTIDETLEPIIGKDGAKSGEQIVASLQQAARGNAARLGAFVRALPAEESSVVRATMIGQLGRASAGAQDAAGGAFSLPQFLTHWNQMTPGAKRALFDPASRAALDDLAVIAQGSKEASRFANTSNTAGGVVGQTLVTGAVGALFDMGTMAAALASQYGAGRLLASPRFARWLARAPRTRNPQQHLDQLSEIAAKEAAIAPEILGFQQRLTDALVKEPARLSAADQNDE